MKIGTKNWKMKIWGKKLKKSIHRSAIHTHALKKLQSTWALHIGHVFSRSNQVATHSSQKICLQCNLVGSLKLSWQIGQVSPVAFNSSLLGMFPYLWKNYFVLAKIGIKNLSWQWSVQFHHKNCNCKNFMARVESFCHLGPLHFHTRPLATAFIFNGLESIIATGFPTKFGAFNAWIAVWRCNYWFTLESSRQISCRLSSKARIVRHESNLPTKQCTTKTLVSTEANHHTIYLLHEFL